MPRSAAGEHTVASTSHCRPSAKKNENDEVVAVLESQCGPKAAVQEISQEAFQAAPAEVLRAREVAEYVSKGAHPFWGAHLGARLAQRAARACQRTRLLK